MYVECINVGERRRRTEQNRHGNVVEYHLGAVLFMREFVLPLRARATTTTATTELAAPRRTEAGTGALGGHHQYLTDHADHIHNDQAQDDLYNILFGEGRRW